MLCDVHCHFFSQNFFETIGRVSGQQDWRGVLLGAGWEVPGTAVDLAKKWVEELEMSRVDRAALIASVPNDEDSVKQAIQAFPERFVGFFMVDPNQSDATGRLASEVGSNLVCPCLFPAMHGYSLEDAFLDPFFAAADSSAARALFVHCGVLRVGVRKKFGLEDCFDPRKANPLGLLPLARRYRELPIIVPHFGAGFFREALMLADQCENVYLDTSSSNGWMQYYPELTLKTVFRQALKVVGPDRLLFGSDSSFFPRGWQRSTWEVQSQVLTELDLSELDREKVFSENFNRLFPLSAS